MKRFFFLTILICFSLSASAQNFNYSTDQHIDEELMTAYTSHYINFSTPVPQAITYRFETLSNTISDDWDLSLCDYVSCYVGVPATGVMKSITLEEAENGTEGFFNLTVSHNNIDGGGFVELYVYELGNYENGDTVSWNLTFESSVATTDVELNDFFNVYPNPTRDVLNITSNGYQSGNVYNSTGRKVMNLTSSNINSIDVASLAKGVYIISLQDQFGQSYSKQFIIH